MLPWLRERPLTLVRAPDGVGGKRYFQKAVSGYAPEWIRTVRIPAPSAGRDVDFVVCDDRATLLWLGNQATLEFHPAPVRADRLDRPDLLVVDIDPPDGAFEAAVEVALLVLEVLDELGVATGVKTTGGKGLHIVAPIERRYDAEQLRGAAARLTAIVAARRPDLVTDEFRKAEAAGPRDARSVPQRHRRDDRGAVLTARSRGGDRVLPRDAGRARVGVARRFHDRDRARSLDRPGPKRWSALAEERNRIPTTLLRD